MMYTTAVAALLSAQGVLAAMPAGFAKRGEAFTPKPLDPDSPVLSLPKDQGGQDACHPWAVPASGPNYHCNTVLLGRIKANAMTDPALKKAYHCSEWMLQNELGCINCKKVSGLAGNITTDVSAQVQNYIQEGYCKAPNTDGSFDAAYSDALGRAGGYPKMEGANLPQNSYPAPLGGANLDPAKVYTLTVSEPTPEELEKAAEKYRTHKKPATHKNGTAPHKPEETNKTVDVVTPLVLVGVSLEYMCVVSGGVVKASMPFPTNATATNATDSVDLVACLLVCSVSVSSLDDKVLQWNCAAPQIVYKLEITYVELAVECKTAVRPLITCEAAVCLGQQGVVEIKQLAPVQSVTWVAGSPSGPSGPVTSQGAKAPGAATPEGKAPSLPASNGTNSNPEDCIPYTGSPAGSGAQPQASGQVPASTPGKEAKHVSNGAAAPKSPEAGPAAGPGAAAPAAGPAAGPGAAAPAAGPAAGPGAAAPAAGPGAAAPAGSAAGPSSGPAGNKTGTADKPKGGNGKPQPQTGAGVVPHVSALAAVLAVAAFL